MAASDGTAWARAYAGELRAQRRPVTGGWPGTMTEARARALAMIAGRGTVTTELLHALARTTYKAARDAWQELSVPDHEL